MEDVIVVALAPVILVLMTGGAVLFLHFWGRRIARSIRVILAVGVVAGILLGMIAASGDGEIAVFLAVAVGCIVITLPAAYLATRKIDRMSSQSISVFE